MLHAADSVGIGMVVLVVQDTRFALWGALVDVNIRRKSWIGGGSETTLIVVSDLDRGYGCGRPRRDVSGGGEACEV